MDDAQNNDFAGNYFVEYQIKISHQWDTANTRALGHLLKTVRKTTNSLTHQINSVREALGCIWALVGKIGKNGV